MSEQHEVFEFGELNTISFECPKCRTEVFFSLDTPTMFGAPHACPTCHTEFVELAQVLARYRDLYTGAGDLAKRLRLRFRIRR